MKSLEYFYLIRHKPSGKFYAGSKYAKKQFIHPDQFWNPNWIGPGKPYYTTSKIIKKLILDEGLNSFEVLELIPRPNGDALLYETVFLTSFDAKNSDMWFNQNNGSVKFRCSGHSDETKRKMSISHLGRRPSEETISKIKHSNLGKHRSIETRAKLSESALGRVMSKETKAKIAIANVNRKHTEETKAKISQSNMNKTQTKYKCPWCSIMAVKSNAHRWHFDNCKHKTTHISSMHSATVQPAI